MNKQSDRDDRVVRGEGDEGQAREAARDERASRLESWRRQIVGAVIGAFIALALAGLAMQGGWIEGNLVTYALWGGVIGSVIGGSESLQRAGSRLTQRDAPVLNLIVALLGMVIFFGIIFLIVIGLSRLLKLA